MIQLQVLIKILDTKDASFIIQNGLTVDYFSEYKEEFNFIKAHLDTYNVIPDKTTFFAQFPHCDNIVVTEPAEYLLTALRNDYKSRFLAKTFNSIKTKVMNGDVDGAMSIFSQSFNQASKTTNLEAVDILKNTQDRYQAYLDRCVDFNKYYISTGFPELDEILGGWDRTEELVTIAARTNVGKSWMLFKMAAAAVEQNLRVGIYEGEMTERKVGYRLDTMFSHISNSGLIRGKDDLQVSYKKFLEELQSKHPDATCMVLTPSRLGRAAGVNDLRAFIEKYDLDILFVDQRSLLMDDRRAKNPVEVAANISQDLKILQTLKKIPIITVSQQNRSSTENGVGTEHIAQSDRISQDSTIIIFFEQDKEHRLLTMSLAKSRDSERGVKLQYAFDFDHGIFEYIPAEAEDGANPTFSQISSNHVQALVQEFESDPDENVEWT